MGLARELADAIEAPARDTTRRIEVAGATVTA
ncbi:MAG: hypothetical protein JWN13_2800 [Betaproteobacteria bacterium]|jgi:hypothetical protein|nr:hypothetical protein [Betaproteobacteria bacterium]